MILTIPRAAALTANQRLHWRAKAERTRALRTRGRHAWLNAGLAPMDRAHLTVTLAWHDARRRDPGNWSPTAKALVDGMVSDAGALPDDDTAHLIGPDLRGETDPAVKPGTIRLTFDWRPL